MSDKVETTYDRPYERVLVVADFTGNTGKIARHVGPLAEVTAQTTMVCLTPDPSLDAIDYRTPPTLGYRPLDLLLLFVVALVEGVRTDYDAIVSFSLIPYGLFGLCLRPVVRAPVHLGILGVDVDVHARSWFGRPVRAAFRQFDCVSVPGETHRQRLAEMGVAPRRTAVLTNAIDRDVYRPASDSADADPAESDPEYDFAWVGRFGPEKNPLLFVRALADLRERGHDFRAVMVGDGDLREDVEREIERAGLADAVELAGWVEEPVAYYRQSRIFALTSSRDALALSLLEAMATGLACVAPAVGNTPDVLTHRENGLLLETMDEQSLADAFELLLCDPALCDRLGDAATAIGNEHSFARAREDWEEILAVVDGRTRDGNHAESSASGT